MRISSSLLLFALCWTIGLSPAHISRVIDGDTVVLTTVRVWPGVAVTDERVRLLGVDAAELNAPKGPDAKVFTENWLLGGAMTLRVCKRDAFGRLLGEVKRGDESLADALIGATLGVKR